VSPGGLTNRNRDTAFRGSRPGAKAEYAYGQINLSHQHPLPRGFYWNSSATVQLASGALLGTEQLNGGGAYSVRGYPESSAFGDWGIVASNELHAPPVSAIRGHDNIDLFCFVDVASLNLHVDDESTDLRSAGVGVNYQLTRHFSLRAAYGWHPRNSNGPRMTESGHGHISVNASW
jgi:hemolysin activation/secretion protein